MMNRDKWMISALLCLVFTEAMGQTYTKSDWQKMALKGAVQSVQTQAFRAILSGNNSKKGKEITRPIDFERLQLLTGFVIGHSQIIFNRNGERVDIISYNSKDSINRRWHFYYDDNGRNICIKKYFTPFGVTVTGDTGMMDNAISYPKSEGLDYTILKNKYNRSGQLIEQIEKNREEKITSETVYAYDKQGRLIGKKTKEMTPDTATTMVKYGYSDSENQLEQENYYSGFTLGQKISYQYLPYGRKRVIERLYDTDGHLKSQIQFVFDKKENLKEIRPLKDSEKIYQHDSVPKKISIDYTYDKKGNWIKAVVLRKNTPLFILERDISYF